MSTTITTLTTDLADVTVLVRCLAHLGSDVSVDDRTPGYLAVRSLDERLLFHIEAPSLIHVPGEARRLLDRDEPALPYWWLDIHIPASAPADARQLAVTLSQALTQV